MVALAGARWAYLPASPDRVYLGLSAAGRGARLSEDGGLSFRDLGQVDTGPVNDLALGAYGQTLYVATDQGLWRFAVGGWHAGPGGGGGGG